MTLLKIYDENEPNLSKTYRDSEIVARSLAKLDVHFAHWKTEKPLAAGASQEEVLEAYRDSVDQLCHEYGFKSVDVISVKPDHPDRKALREKFLSEHTHQDFEPASLLKAVGSFIFIARVKFILYFVSKVISSAYLQEWRTGLIWGKSRI